MVLDEIHGLRALTLVILEYLLGLIVAGDPRCRRVKIILVTATPTSPTMSVIKKCVTAKQLRFGEFRLNSGVSSRRVVDLFDGEGGRYSFPHVWSQMSIIDQACHSVTLMIRWLRDNRGQSAQILVIVAGKAEVDMMTLALRDVSKKCAGGWRVHGIMPERSPFEFPRVCELLDKQRFAARSPTQIVVLTAGIGEDSLTMYINGLIDSGKAMALSLRTAF